jgi:hypothetical protein
MQNYTIMLKNCQMEKHSAKAKYNYANLGSKLGSHHIKEGSLTSVLCIGYT